MVFGSTKRQSVDNTTMQESTNTTQSSPFFARRNSPPAPLVEEPKSGGLFRKNTVKDQNLDATPVGEKKGLFGRKSVDVDSSPERRSSGGLFSKQDSLKAAQTKLAGAQQAEKAADPALLKARAAVKEARAEIAALEKEAHLEAKRAAAKVKAAKSLHKEGDKLGRHA